MKFTFHIKKKITNSRQRHEMNFERKKKKKRKKAPCHINDHARCGYFTNKPSAIK